MLGTALVAGAAALIAGLTVLARLAGFGRTLAFTNTVGAGSTGDSYIAANAVPNIEALGTALYTRYLIPFELAGLILLVAMIGAIVLTHRSRGDVRGQNASRQIGRRPGDATRNTRPAVGEGVSL